MELLDRIKKAGRIMLRGEPQKRKRGEIPAITAQEVAEIKQFFPRDKFFIFGHARSGTTLLVRLVRLHPEVHCNYQAHFFSRKPLLKSLVSTPEAEEWLTRKSNRWNEGRDLSPLVLRAAADLVMEREAAREGKRVVGDKSPLSTIHGQAVRDLAALYPDAKLLYLIRDGRDVLISERFRNFIEESKFLGAEDRRIMADLLKDPDGFTAGRRSIFTETFIRRMANGWVTDVAEVEAAGRRLFGKGFLALRYEDLLHEPFETMSEVWRFLGVKRVGKSFAKNIKAEMASNPDEEWQTRRNEELSSFLTKGQTGNWRTLFSASDKALFKQIAGEMLIKWGYEQDASW